MKTLHQLPAIFLTAGMLLHCSSNGVNSETATDKPLTPTEKLVTDLKSEYGPFTHTTYDSLQKMRFIGYSYKGGRDMPDLFRQTINKSFNLIGKEVNLKYDVSSQTKVDLGQYLWETPQYRINLMSNAKADSVYVRLWIDEYAAAIGD